LRRLRQRGDQAARSGRGSGARGISRRGLFGAAGGVTLPALAACGGAGGGAAPARQEAAGTIRYLTWWGTDRVAVIDAWKAGFRAEAPRVTVETELVAQAEYPAKVQVGLASGTAPDVVLARHEAQTRWYELDAVVAWRWSSDLTVLNGVPVRLRVRLKDADVYAIQFRD
jgi:ABC-type glycerol-3-phosphate transport system substrate-binding protein